MIERLAVVITPALAQGTQWRHAVSLFDEPRYPRTFKQFDYVNVQAPKAGVVRMLAIGTFNNLNITVGASKGALANGLDLVTETLMVEALDEVSCQYGLLAEAVSYPINFASFTFRLRAEAKWHDGRPVTPDDVIFSFDAAKQYDPRLGGYYRNVSKVEKTGEREVTFIFDGPSGREFPLILGQLKVLPRHWWEEMGPQGRKRNIALTTAEPPLGSGPYRIRSVDVGRTISYERFGDYWGKELNVRVGQHNFDEIRFEYFRDTTAALEAFKADQVDWRVENSAKNWATAYDFPAVREQQVILEEFPINNTALVQAFVFNVRQEKFKDLRLRRALSLTFDFETLNKQLFFGQYRRAPSYFEGTELASSSMPTAKELEILNLVRDIVPSQVFALPYAEPEGGSPEKTRANLTEAARLLRQAGYEISNRRLVNPKTKEPLHIEVLVDDPIVERVALFFKPSVERLGIGMTVRTVDDVQYQGRLQRWDYDVILQGWEQTLSPGNDQRDYWSSPAADISGSRNLIGIKDRAVDVLIDRIISAENRFDLVAAVRALDRVLSWNQFAIARWTYGKSRTARWNRFGRPDHLPKYGTSAFPSLWWWDEIRASNLRRNR